MDKHDPSLAEFLMSIPIFREAAPGRFATLMEHLQAVEVAAGDVVVREGEPADGLYVVVTGRLRASVETNGAIRNLTELSRGQLFGEIALLTSQPRTATVRAVRDSYLLRLPRQAFERMATHDPGVVLPLTSVVVDRLLRADKGEGQEEERVRTLAVLPLGPPTLVDETVGLLEAALSGVGPTKVVTSQLVEGVVGLDPREVVPGGPGSGQMIEVLTTIESEHRFVVYSTDREISHWTRWCLREADRILLVADAASTSAITELEREVARTVPAEAQVPHDLVLVRGPDAAGPTGTAAWLTPRPGAAHHHIRRGNRPDHERLARSVAGRAQGLVLGGGGARGFAHLGVMKALEDAGVPVDVVGGTSIGAVMGGFFAVGLTHDERLEAAEEVFLRNSLFRPTLPVVSLTSGKAVARLLEDPRLHAQTAIEDLPRSYFCISANLSRAELNIHERGPIATAMRASFSIPGIFPPVAQGNDLLVDGGVMNNLPVDVMRQRLGGGRIIAVDLRPDVDLTVREQTPLAVSGWRVASEAVLRRRGMGLPNTAEILLRTLELGSTRSQRDALAAAAIDLYLRPPIEGCGLLDFKGGRLLIDSAYRATLEQLGSAPTLIRTSA